jgi:hypothetical protein
MLRLPSFDISILISVGFTTGIEKKNGPPKLCPLLTLYGENDELTVILPG